MNPKNEFLKYRVYSFVLAGFRSIEQITRLSDGLYSPQVEAILLELVNDQKIKITPNGYYPIKQDSRTSRLKSFSKKIDISNNLPFPHPCDFDWRFTNHTSYKVVETIVDNSLVGRKVLLIGTPSIYLGISCLKYPPQTYMMEGNEGLVKYLSGFIKHKNMSIINRDLIRQSIWEDEKKFDIVICDPPWYEEYYSKFLLQASLSATVGATIMVSLLPLNSRKTAASERTRFFEFANTLGFSLVEQTRQYFEYREPMFERMAWVSNKETVTQGWHFGDLAVFHKTFERKIKHYVVSNAEFESILTGSECWNEVYIGRCKVILRGPISDFEQQPKLFNIEQENILPTVNRDYSGRSKIDLWLWNNYVFGVTGKAAFWAALNILAKGSIPAQLQSVPERYISTAKRILKELLMRFDEFDSV